MGGAAARTGTRSERRVLVPPVSGPLTRPAPGPVRSLSGDTMGTSWTVKLAGRPDLPLETVRAGVVRVLDGVVAEMSGWEPDSDLSRYNAAAPDTWHELPDGFLTVLRAALAVAELTDGAFDPTLGALVDGWGFGPSDSGPGLGAPSQRSVAPGLKRLRLDGRRLYQPGGLSLDLSGIAKGYAVDRVADAVRALGATSMLVEIGGELRGEGVKADLSPWWVSLEQPPGVGLPETLLALHGLSVATSGDYQRFRWVAGRRVSHTLDPATGAPIGEGVASVSVIHPSCMLADAWATALTVLGPDRGMRAAERNDVAARWLARTGDGFAETCTPAFERFAGDTLLA